MVDLRRWTPQDLTHAGLLLFAWTLPLSHVPAQFGAVLTLIGWLWWWMREGKPRTDSHPVLLPLGLYVGWSMLSAALSERPIHSITAVFDNEWPAFLGLLVFWGVRDAAFLKKLLYGFLISSSIAMAYAIVQTIVGVEYYSGKELHWMGGGHRAVGFYGFYLTFAGLAMTVFFLTSGLSLESQGKARRWFLSLTVLSLVAILGTFARSIWLSLVIGIPVMGFLRNRKLGAQLSALVAVIALSIFLAAPSIRERAKSIVDLEQNETRLNLWTTAVHMTAASPVFGFGQDNWDHHLDEFKVEGYYDVMSHPHNDYLNVLVSSGVPGLAFFLWMWFVVIRNGTRTWLRVRTTMEGGIALGGILGILGFLVGGFFQNYYGTFANCLGWWLIAGLVLASGKLVGMKQA